ncbi:MAG TPA: Trm112 family protein [Terriglobales bacterium]|nr:Trm112 family protein [Terriglobales bacterium]
MTRRTRAQGVCVIHPELLEILACPLCKTPLAYNEKANTLKCGQCRRVYPIREEIPVLLVDQATIDES